MTVSCNFFNTVLKVRKRMVVWLQNGFKCISCLPEWLCGWLGGGAHCCCPGSGERILLQSSQEKIKMQNAKFRVRLLLNMYHFHTIVNLKNHNWIIVSWWLSVYFTYLFYFLSFFSISLSALRGRDVCLI